MMTEASTSTCLTWLFFATLSWLLLPCASPATDGLVLPLPAALRHTAIVSWCQGTRPLFMAVGPPRGYW